MAKLTGIKRQKRKYVLVLLGLLLGPLLIMGKLWLLAQVSNWTTAFPNGGDYYCQELDARLRWGENAQWQLEFAEEQPAEFGTLTYGWTGSFNAWVEEDDRYTKMQASGVYFWEQIGDAVYLYFDRCPEDMDITGHAYRFVRVEPTQ